MIRDDWSYKTLFNRWSKMIPDLHFCLLPPHKKFCLENWFPCSQNNFSLDSCFVCNFKFSWFLRHLLYNTNLPVQRPELVFHLFQFDCTNNGLKLFLWWFLSFFLVSLSQIWRSSCLTTFQFTQPCVSLHHENLKSSQDIFLTTKKKLPDQWPPCVSVAVLVVHFCDYFGDRSALVMQFTIMRWRSWVGGIEYWSWR